MTDREYLFKLANKDTINTIDIAKTMQLIFGHKFKCTSINSCKWSELENNCWKNISVEDLRKKLIKSIIKKMVKLVDLLHIEASDSFISDNDKKDKKAKTQMISRTIHILHQGYYKRPILEHCNILFYELE